MAKLLAKSPCDGLLPLRHGEMTLTEVDPGPMISIQPFAGQDGAVEDALGMALPKPGHSVGDAGQMLIWFGQDSFLTLGFGPEDTLRAHAAISDQSDAWAVVSLSGQGAEDVLSRLVPVDMRAAAFEPGRCCRTLVEHMNAAILRTGPSSFHILVFRSMAKTLVHDLGLAMSHVAARSGI